MKSGDYIFLADLWIDSIDKNKKTKSLQRHEIQNERGTRKNIEILDKKYSESNTQNWSVTEGANGITKINEVFPDFITVDAWQRNSEKFVAQCSEKENSEQEIDNNSFSQTMLWLSAQTKK